MENKTKKRWTYIGGDSGDPGYYTAFIEVACPFCGAEISFENGEYGWSWGDPIPFEFCPFCGEKLEE